MKIGVVIPVYNGESSIKKSIKSLINQTLKDWIAIIINDGSIDKTKEILDKYNYDNRFHIIHFKENKGRPYARQKGLETIKKLDLKYMCMLDADDWYYPKKLELQFKFMENNPDTSLLSSAIGVTNKKQELFRAIKPFNEIQFFKFKDYRNYKMIPHASSIIRVEKIRDDLSYNYSLKLSQDQDFLRRLLINKKYAFDPNIQYIYNRSDSFSLKKYRNSMYYNFLSFKNLKLGKKYETIQLIKNKVKYGIVWLLSLFNLQQIYLSKIGVVPTYLELVEYKENQSKLS